MKKLLIIIIFIYTFGVEVRPGYQRFCTAINWLAARFKTLFKFFGRALCVLKRWITKIEIKYAVILLTFICIAGFTVSGLANNIILFDPITADITFATSRDIAISSAEFDHQGNIDDEVEMSDERFEMLMDEFEITAQAAPNDEFLYILELVEYEFFDSQIRFRIHEQLPPTIPVSEVNSNLSEIIFTDIEFTDPGIYTFQITQIMPADVEAWRSELDYHLVMIKVQENLETEKLDAYKSSGHDINFTSTFYYDISDRIGDKLRLRWDNHLATVCDNLDKTPIIDVVNRYADAMAIHFENFETGCTFIYGQHRNFFAASTTKAPFALWIYTMADRGEVDLDELLTFTWADNMVGSGIIRHRYSFGTQFTIRDVIGLNIYQSDNVATRMLLRRFGHQGFTNFATSRGADRNHFPDFWNARLTPDLAGFYMREIFNYIEGDYPNSEIFKEQLLNNQFPFIVADYPIASKTGWHSDFGGAWNDMAIIYAPSPYSLSLLSAHRRGTALDHHAYQELSRAFQEFNEINFINPWP